MKARIREFFPGGNTALGFFSYYDQIIGPDATRILVIKGGPGVGKSSFMREIATALNGQGFDVELHHCASDPASLDGVVFPQIGVALIDGTSPHVLDPRNPGAVDEILNFGDFWDETGMRRARPEILTRNREVARLFDRAYRYLKAAKVIHDDLDAIYSAALDRGQANLSAANLAATIFAGRPAAPNPGKIRKLFISAITPDGFRNYLPGLMETMNTIYAVEGPPGSGKSTLLAKLVQAATERGIDGEAFYCAFNPYKIEHFVIPSLKVMITTAIEPHRIDISRATTIIDMGQYINPSAIIHQSAVIETNRYLVDNLLKQAIATIAQAKAVHDSIEQYYILHMNFSAINRLRLCTQDRILKYAAEVG